MSEQHPLLILNGVVGGPLGPADRRRIEPVASSGFQREIDVGVNPIAGTTPQAPAILNWTLQEPAVVRVQFDDVADAIAIGFDGQVVCATGIDGGVTTVRYRLQSWGVALQVPAGATTLAINSLASSLLPGVGARRRVNVSISPGYLRERHVCETAIETDSGSTFQPPSFATRAELQFLGIAGASYAFTTPELSLSPPLSTSFPRVLIEAAPITFGAFIGGGNITVDWTVYE